MDIRDKLEAESEEIVKEIAKTLEIKVHHAAKKKSIIPQILHQQPHRIEGAIDRVKGIVEKAKEPTVMNTKEDVKKALEPLKSRLPDFQVTFPDDGTWIFSYKGAEDSGNLGIPLRVIVMKANNVARGKRSLMSLGREETDKSYAGTILSA